MSVIVESGFAPEGKSGVSWPAIIAGAFVAVGATVILLALGSGLGFASVSPWSGHGASAAVFTMTAAIWLLVTQWVSAGLGGYIAGRLRSRWLGTHAHEVFFRDTAHGLVTWAVATVLVASALTSTFAALVQGTSAAASAASPERAASVRAAAGNGGDSSYAVDKLFRSSRSDSPGARWEADRIIANAVAAGQLPDTDRNYLAAKVAEQAAIPPAEAQARVNDLFATALDAEASIKAEADRARKAAAETSIYIALSLLVGAFIASVAAAVGGRLRDEHV